MECFENESDTLKVVNLITLQQIMEGQSDNRRSILSSTHITEEAKKSFQKYERTAACIHFQNAWKIADLNGTQVIRTYRQRTHVVNASSVLLFQKHGTISKQILQTVRNLCQE